MLILETSKWRAAGEARVEGAPHTVPAPPCSPARLEDQERGRREPGDECRPHHCVQSHINGRPEAGGPLSPGPGRLLACGPREMRAELLAALLAVVLVPSAQAVWLGRGMATHSSTLAGGISWTGSLPGYSLWGYRVGHDW